MRKRIIAAVIAAFAVLGIGAAAAAPAMAATTASASHAQPDTHYYW